MILHRILIAIVLAPVRLYRRVISPMKRVPSCRFLPTCSEYAIEAVQQRGIVVGGGLATWRILRCNPLCRAGYDPVPAAGSSRRRDHAQERH
jgi:putative membrane protein insertion efficiency factor